MISMIKPSMGVEREKENNTLQWLVSELDSMGYDRQYEYDCPMGIKLTRKQIESYPRIPVYKWLSKDEKVTIKAWDNYDYVIVRSRRQDDCFYKYVHISQILKHIPQP